MERVSLAECGQDHIRIAAKREKSNTAAKREKSNTAAKRTACGGSCFTVAYEKGMSVVLAAVGYMVPQRLPCGALAIVDAAASYPSNPAIPKNVII